MSEALWRSAFQSSGVIILLRGSRVPGVAAMSGVSAVFNIWLVGRLLGPGHGDPPGSLPGKRDAVPCPRHVPIPSFKDEHGSYFF